MTVELMAYSAAQAAEAIGVSPDRVRELCARGDLPGRRIGGRWLIPVRRLEQWLEDGPDVLADRSAPSRHGRVAS